MQQILARGTPKNQGVDINDFHSLVGHWERRIPVPLVPAAVVVLPLSHKVLMWAADRGDVFGNDTSNPGRTITSIFDPMSGIVTERNVSITNHDMFCPGLSMDVSGRPTVTGGKSEQRVSIYDETLDVWISGPDMKIGRGYHAQATLSDGRTFTIGGSWSGPIGGMDGEAFDPSTGTWSWLHECKVAPMLTNDLRGVFCSDNHPWLFSWKNSSVFQAGPSSAMNWYGTSGNGRHAAAGYRARDTDAMNGNAVMYDAVHGHILTLGGATSYSGAYSTRSAHIITLTEPFVPPSVQAINPMHHPRAYANSVILPTGEVFINGGTSFAKQWTDINATMIPELWSPETQKFIPMARTPIPRTYHSTAILLPDATVLVGGGGLCWGYCEDPSANHFDIQIFSPPYLFNAKGFLSSRPSITSVSTKTIAVGSSFRVTTNMEVGHFSFLRYGSSTHAINTDQRRIVLASKLLQETVSAYMITTPKDPGILIPGYWMLFAIGSEGIPSVAETILVNL
ncbi:putative galactose oxidase precursor [Mollisia scopiformis]|uniref:Putative galactose oxidase n=1 Tax=Mollisia scopiformis TaxID=149040 RepID=A0A194XUG6_MOLSC|nr:putative galactose oxidase precursor [Mollisia scopiformis]KUJ23679.1 putative galactose oxidase precursor [Mollisia scopiformis]